MQYPFIDKVKQALSEKKESFEWLAHQIGKSRRWIYNQSLEELSLELIVKLTDALELISWKIIIPGGRRKTKIRCSGSVNRQQNT